MRKAVWSKRAFQHLQRAAFIAGAGAILSGCAFSGGVPSAPSPFGFASANSGTGSGYGDLLYVANGSTKHGVSILSYPDGTPVATISKIGSPRGVCADKSGNVWVTAIDKHKGAIYLFARGATTPLAKVRLKLPVAGCATDPTTGNVAALETAGSDSGAVEIFPGSLKGNAKSIALSMSPVACDYDYRGNLICDGKTSSATFVLVDMAKGTKTFAGIKLGRASIWSAGDVVWDGNYITVGVGVTKGSSEKSVIFRLSIANGKAIVFRNGVHLHDLSANPWYAVHRTRVIATKSGNLGVRRIALFHYPRGGRKINVFSGFDNPVGIAISQAPKL